MNLKPIADQILLKIKKVTDKTETGLFISEAMKKEKQKLLSGPIEVIAVGTSVKEVKAGDKVLLRGNSPLALLDMDAPEEGYELASISEIHCIYIVS